ncbi:MAG: hypothetical protein AB1Z23_05005 [Eubacteriales bacterium]
MIEIKTVETKKQRKEFVNFIYKLYKGNKYWAPQFKESEMAVITPGKQAAHEFCESKYFLAYKDGKLAGRIGAIINFKTNEQWNENAVRFTRFDFIDDYEVSGALLKAVEEWGKKEYSADKCQGPLGYSDLDQEGMLIEGFEEMGTFVTLYNYKYYVDHMVHHGYGKDIDWMEYRFEIPEKVDKRIHTISKMLQNKAGYKLLEFKKTKDLLPYAKSLFDVWNKTYIVLFGAALLSEAQVDEVIKDFIGIVNPEFIKLVADKDDNIVAFGICIPSLTKAAQKAKGNMFPFGLLYFLHALKKNDTMDMYLVGVLPELQGKGVNAILMDGIMQTAIRYKMKYAESNPELEDNEKVQSQWKGFEKRQHRRRRCWMKEI